MDFFMGSQRKESNQVFDSLDMDNSGSASVNEIETFVRRHEELWENLATKLKQPTEIATQVATRVAMELATGLQGQAALDAQLTKHEFHEFRKRYILSPEGQQEFFYRAVYANFDVDNSSSLDENELDLFLDTIYESGIHPDGVESLPEKDAVRKALLDRSSSSHHGRSTESNGNGGSNCGDRRLTYTNIRGVMAGNKELLQSATEYEEQIKSERELERKRAEAERLLWEAKKAEEELQRQRQESKNKAQRQVKREDCNFCDWLDRKLAGPEDVMKGNVRQNFCRRNGCSIQ